MEAEAKPSPNLSRILEALLFASDRPLRTRELRQLMPEVGPKELADAFRELGEEYDRTGRSFELVEIEGGHQVLTRREYALWVRRLRSEVRTMRLSRAAVETLAIIAYRQPTTRSEIEQIRGVDAGGVLRTLLDRDLITLRGRAEGVGRPLLYGTTDFFLNHFGLKGLDELPKIEELAEIMKSKEMAEIEAEVEEALGPRAAAGGEGAPLAAEPADPGEGGAPGPAEEFGEEPTSAFPEDPTGPEEPMGEDEEPRDVAIAGDL